MSVISSNARVRVRARTRGTRFLAGLSRPFFVENAARLPQKNSHPQPRAVAAGAFLEKKKFLRGGCEFA